MNKLGLSEEQVGEMTLTKFYRLYNQYKRTHDVEQQMMLSGKTYQDADYQPTIDDIL